MLMRLIFIIMLIFTSTANAEVKTYSGTGEYIMSEFETLDIAKQRAKQKAERHAQEQAGVYVSSYTKVKNAQVSEDEIITITSGIMNVVDVDYEVTPLDKGKSIHIVAKIKANIDTDDINKWLAKGIEERSNLAAQNKELQKAIAEQDKQIAELKKQLADVKTQQDRDRITQEFANEDKIFLSNQKVEEASIFVKNNDLILAIMKCTEALELNPKNSEAYFTKGVSYIYLQDYRQAIIEFNKCISINPNIETAYYNRAIAYDNLKNYRYSISDYDKAIQINPNYIDAYNNRGLAHKNLKNFQQAMNDFNKVISLNPNDDKAYYNRGSIYSLLFLTNNSSRYNELAIMDLSKAIALNPNEGLYYFGRGLIYMLLNEVVLSKNDFNKAKELGFKP